MGLDMEDLYNQNFCEQYIGRALLWSGQVKGAIPVLAKAVRWKQQDDSESPHYGQMLFDLGFCYFFSGEDGKAAKMMEKCLGVRENLAMKKEHQPDFVCTKIMMWSFAEEKNDELRGDCLTLLQAQASAKEVFVLLLRKNLLQLVVAFCRNGEFESGMFVAKFCLGLIDNFNQSNSLLHAEVLYGYGMGLKTRKEKLGKATKAFADSVAMMKKLKERQSPLYLRASLEYAAILLDTQDEQSMEVLNDLSTLFKEQGKNPREAYIRFLRMYSKCLRENNEIAKLKEINKEIELLLEQLPDGVTQQRTPRSGITSPYAEKISPIASPKKLSPRKLSSRSEPEPEPEVKPEVKPKPEPKLEEAVTPPPKMVTGADAEAKRRAAVAKKAEQLQKLTEKRRKEMLQKQLQLRSEKERRFKEQEERRRAEQKQQQEEEKRREELAKQHELAKERARQLQEIEDKKARELKELKRQEKEKNRRTKKLESKVESPQKEVEVNERKERVKSMLEEKRKSNQVTRQLEEIKVLSIEEQMKMEWEEKQKKAQAVEKGAQSPKGSAGGDEEDEERKARIEQRKLEIKRRLTKGASSSRFSQEDDDGRKGKLESLKRDSGASRTSGEGEEEGSDIEKRRLERRADLKRRLTKNRDITPVGSPVVKTKRSTTVNEADQRREEARKRILERKDRISRSTTVLDTSSMKQKDAGGDTDTTAKKPTRKLSLPPPKSAEGSSRRRPSMNPPISPRKESSTVSPRRPHSSPPVSPRGTKSGGKFFFFYFFSKLNADNFSFSCNFSTIYFSANDCGLFAASNQS
jgi:hypothetical protein